MRKRIAIVVLVMCAIFLLAACGSASSSPIIGTWKDEATGLMTIEFKDDGTLSVSALGQTQTGTYQVDGDKITTKVGDDEASVTYKVEGDKLTITSEDDVSEVYVKE